MTISIVVIFGTIVIVIVYSDVIAVVIQVKQQLVDTEQDYARLENTPFVTSLGISLGDLKWAADMATSRSFAIPKGLGGDCISSLSAMLRPHNRHGLHDDCNYMQ